MFHVFRLQKWNAWNACLSPKSKSQSQKSAIQKKSEIKNPNGAALLNTF